MIVLVKRIAYPGGELSRGDSIPSDFPAEKLDDLIASGAVGETLIDEVDPPIPVVVADDDDDDAPSTICDECGFVAASLRGLSIHARSHSEDDL